MNTDLIRNFGNDFTEIANAKPDSIAITVKNKELSGQFNYSELLELVNKCIHFYHINNIAPGERILSVLPHCIESLVSFLGVAKGGFEYAPVPYEITAREFERSLNLLKPSVCLCDKKFHPDLIKLCEHNNIPMLAIDTDLEFSWLPETCNTYVNKNDSTLYLSTSGTTGEPKAIVIDINTLWSSGYKFLEYHNLLNTPLKFWNYLSLSYLGGLFNLTLIPLVTGGEILLTESFHPRMFLFFWKTVEEHKLNAIWFVPTLLKGLLNIAGRSKKPFDTNISKQLKCCFLGTAPIDLETKEKFEATFNLTLFENFALSETTFFTSESFSTIKNRTEGSVGKILPYTDIKFVSISNEDETDCSNKVTEMYVKSPFLFKGYLQEDNNLLLELDDEGYFATGDLGHIEENTVIIDGRKKDVIKKGGFFVSLREMEIIAQNFEHVKEAAAVTIPHDFYGESYVLFIEISGEKNHLYKEFQNWFQSNIIKYKWPEKIVFKEGFPRTSSGKVRKKELLKG